jgi:hypothetical protein
MPRRLHDLILLVALLLTGCSAGGSLQVTSTQPPPLLPAHPSLRLQVNPVVAQANPLLPDIRAALLAQLMASGRFSQVVAYPAHTDLLITVDIANVVEIAPAERVLLGLAGRNRIGATIRLIDPASGDIIKTFDAEGSSAAQPLADASGMRDAIQQFARQVAEGAAL